MKNIILNLGFVIVTLVSCQPSAEEKLNEYKLLKAKQQDTLNAFLKNDKILFEIGLEINAQEELAKEAVFNRLADNKNNVLHLSEKQISENTKKFEFSLDSVHKLYFDNRNQNSELRRKNRNALSKDVQALIPVEYDNSTRD